MAFALQLTPLGQHFGSRKSNPKSLGSKTTIFADEGHTKTRHWALLCVTALLFGAFLWPGVYRYDRLGDHPIRTNRITGAVQAFTENGWTSLGSGGRKESLPVPQDVLVKITGTGGFQYGTAFSAQLYNGSDWTIYEIEYEISAVPPQAVGARRNSLLSLIPGADTTSKLWTRRFRESAVLAPMSTATEFFEVGGSVDGYASEWRIVAAKGRKK